jgi:hypothetical protein
LLPVNCHAKSRRYHEAVARLFILFLIVLLPLRGWTAERMAFQMQLGSAVAASVSAMPCAMHLQTASDHHGAAASASAHAPDHKGCQSCQLCMPLASLAAPLLLALVPNPQAQPATGSSRFASAEAALGVKPPIS